MTALSPIAVAIPLMAIYGGGKILNTLVFENLLPCNHDLSKKIQDFELTYEVVAASMERPLGRVGTREGIVLFFSKKDHTETIERSESKFSRVQK